MSATSEHEEDVVRIDKWLWAVRIYKTRSLATEACKNGRIKVGGQVVKASREVHHRDEIDIHLGIYHKTLIVKALLHNRVSAALVTAYLDDVTPESEYEKLKVQHEMKTESRPRGLGRPTKKHRRLIDQLKNKKDFN